MAKLIITIDGPAGSGKSSAAKLLAAKIDAAFLDTGAMYRATALAALQQGKVEARDRRPGAGARCSAIQNPKSKIHNRLVPAPPLWLGLLVAAIGVALIVLAVKL